VPPTGWHGRAERKLDHLAENQISADTIGASNFGDIRVRPARSHHRKKNCWKCGNQFSVAVWEEAQRRLAGLHGFWARFAQREVLTALVEGELLAA